MSASKILMEEHELILDMLEVIDRVCIKIKNHQMSSWEHLDQIIDFIRGFADHCHHAKEEKLLFPAMEEAGIPRDGGPIGVMLADHEAGREFVKQMDSALQKMKSGNVSAGQSFIECATGYAELLSNHIAKENNILFPMGDRFLSETKQSELLAGFEKVEKEEIGQDVHDKYHQVLHHLKNVYIN
jgi:hemerythrin-like domain-containing protein